MSCGLWRRRHPDPVMHVLLISTYELGHQPFGLASPAAWLRREGITVDCVDAARDRVPDRLISGAALIAFYVPMHTATRLAAPLIQRARALNPDATICAYGLYAPLNEAWLRGLGVNEVLGGEFEGELTAVAVRQQSLAASLGAARSPARLSLAAAVPVAPVATRPPQPLASIPKLQFVTPDRSGLPALHLYASLELGGDRRRVVGYTEASRGCRHFCRHCPVVPVYQGQFRVIQPEVVLADIAAQVEAGAQHITFGDPDFFNGPTHAARLVQALHLAHPDLTYDVTIKVEHLLKHRALLPVLRDTGCLFVTSAVESLDDHVLARLDKGHTRRDFLEVVALCRRAGVTLTPTFVAFHPWTTLKGYCDLLDTLADLDLVDHVSPIQLAIRLLIPKGSGMLALPEVAALTQTFDPATLTYRWTHPDPEVEALHQEVNRLVGGQLTAARRPMFEAISLAAHARAGMAFSPLPPALNRAAVPYLSEPWYCCAEPSPEQLRAI
jgi:radical SAM superfamily enzyme YgiQ (UPF0313 family)